jgi:hypothetical protein
MSITPEQLATVNTFGDLAALFHDELGWPQREWQTFKGVPDLYGIDRADIPGVVVAGDRTSVPNAQPTRCPRLGYCPEAAS